MTNELNAEFERIKQMHGEATRKTAARGVLGPSVVRVFSKGTREALLHLLPKIEVDTLPAMRSQEEYSAWFDSTLNRVARKIDSHNSSNTRIRPGLKWGHASKVTSLYVRDLVLKSRYFSDADAKKIARFLHVPIDGVVIDRLGALGVPPPFKLIKEIDTRKKFYAVQSSLDAAARAHKIPRVWFDDNWGDRQ
jgi:hypothetical protein